MNETEAAAGIASGALPSPARFGNSVLVALRISGTGIATRPSIGEKVYRDPLIWLSEETRSRCAGLPVILDHPEGASLDTEEFANRSIGAILLPYVAARDGFQNDVGPDLWAVARLFLDDDQVAQIAGQSTSPCVVFSKTDGNQTIVLPDGTECLCEASPQLIDHLAIVMSGNGAGVWDLGGENSGIRFDSKGKHTMTEEEMRALSACKDAEGGGNIDKLLSRLDAISGRLDAIEKRGDARKDGEGETEEEKAARERADRARRDAELMNHGTHPDPSAQMKADSEKADVQARADSAYQALGKRAPATLHGESLIAYRRRLVRGVQAYSPDWKSVDLTAMADPVAFGVIETKVYADAVIASRNPEVEPGQMLKRVIVDQETGHRVTRFFSNETIFKRFSAQTMRATAFLTPQNLASLGPGR